jgi:hypothetical protein
LLGSDEQAFSSVNSNSAKAARTRDAIFMGVLPVIN